MRPDLNLDYSLLIPELLLGGLALAILFIDLMTKVKKESLPYITVAGLIVALPILIVFVASSKLLVRGVLAGSVKS